MPPDPNELLRNIRIDDVVVPKITSAATTVEGLRQWARDRAADAQRKLTPPAPPDKPPG